MPFIPQPHPAQQRILNERKRFNVVDCGRRWGKSLMGRYLLSLTSLSERMPVAWFAPTYKDLAEIFRDFKVALGDSAKPNEQEKRIEVKGGGSIDFWSLEDPDSGRGRRYLRVVVDEASKVAKLEQAWTQTIRPTLTDFKGDAWFYSTPKGMDYFWKLYQMGMDEEQIDFACWQMPTITNPYIDPAEIEAARFELPEDAFKQEYLAEFIEDGGAVFRKILDAICAVRQSAGDHHHRYVISVDLARQNDFTVINVLDATTDEQVYFERFNQIDYKLQAERLMVVCALFPPQWVIVEQTGNLAFIDFLRDRRFNDRFRGNESRVIPLWPFNTTNASKQEIVQRLAIAFEHGKIKILDEKVQTHELQAFTVERLPSGMYRYAAPEGLHDDCVMSLALGWHAAHYSPHEFIFTEEEKARKLMPQKFQELVDKSAMSADDLSRRKFVEYTAFHAAKAKLNEGKPLDWRRQLKAKYSSKRKLG